MGPVEQLLNSARPSHRNELLRHIRESISGSIGVGLNGPDVLLSLPS